MDYLEHFFYECKQIANLWSHVSNTFNAKFGERVLPSRNDALFGVEHIEGLTKEMLKFLNHLILIAKMYVSKYRYGTPNPLTISFERECFLRNLLK